MAYNFITEFALPALNLLDDLSPQVESVQGDLLRLENECYEQLFSILGRGENAQGYSWVAHNRVVTLLATLVSELKLKQRNVA
jgi:hypothetical protein